MASLGRSFRPPSYLPRGIRAGTAGRSTSTSPELSPAASSSHSEDHFAFSAHTTPRTENPPATGTPGISGSPGAAGERHSHSDHHSQSTNNNFPASTSFTDSSARHGSKPIAIELPAIRKISTAPVSTPPEPLSARGDLPGGYFPLHEDPGKRVHRPHPFHPDVKRGRQRSVSLVAEQMSPFQEGSTAIPVIMSDPAAQPPLMDAINRANPRSNTPVTSYVPMGISDNPLPIGKYYPSNYEQKDNTGSGGGNSNNSRQKHSSLRPPSSTTLAPAKSDSQVPKHKHDSHNRSDSEAKRRLQQYQRDMVAQATLAAREVLGGAAKRGGSSSLAAAGLHGLPLKSMQLGGSIVHKPVSPRLLPLGSPGPVTPMDLEGGEASYLTRGRHVSGPDADRETEEVARAIRAEAERRRREGASSPVVELGPVTF